MKRFLLIISLVISLDNLFAQQNRVSGASVNDLLKVVVNNPKDILGSQYRPKVRDVIDHFVPWDTLSFVFPKDRLPQTKRDREKMMETDYEPYQEFYLYSPFFTDSIFSGVDKAFILSQSKDANRYRKFSFKALNIRFVNDSVLDTKVEDVKYLGYTYPVFSKGLNYAIIRRIECSMWRWNDSTHQTGKYGRDDLQTLYYKKISGKGWKLIFTGSAVIMS